MLCTRSACRTQKFPEVLGLDLDTRMKPNVAFLEKTYQMSGEVLAGTVARKPHVRRPSRSPIPTPAPRIDMRSPAPCGGKAQRLV